MFPFSLGPALACLFLPTLAMATSFFPRSFPDTVKDAPVIARGRVGSSYGDYGTGMDGVKRLYTYYEVSVDETVKGDIPSSSITIKELGGEKDGVGMQVAGSAHFEKGEEVVLMLSDKAADGSYEVRGLMMGKLNLRVNESGKEVLVGPAISGPPEGEGQAGPREGAEWTLDTLKELVRKQGGGSTSTPPIEKTRPARVVRATPSSSAPTVEASPSAAPGLQSSSPRESNDSHGFALRIALGLAVVAGALGFIIRSRR